MYYRSEPGTLTIQEIASRISDEEAGGSKFVESKVTLMKTGKAEALRNIIKFVELDGPVPAEATLAVFGSPAPEGKKEEWTGVMLVSGTQQPVTLYR